MKFYRQIKNVQLPGETIIKAKNFAQHVAATTNYSDSNQNIRSKISDDHFISKVGEEAAKLVLSQFAFVSGPDYAIYAAKEKNWKEDLFIGELGIAVKTQKISSALKYSLSWTFQCGQYRQDPILNNPDAWIVFVEYNDIDKENNCRVFPPYQVKELIFKEPVLAHLKASKKVVYANTLIFQK